MAAEGDLHDRAGSANLIHMHGEHLSAWCAACDARHPWRDPLIHRPPCPACATPALRSDIVGFGEVPYRMDDIHAAMDACDLFVSIGTSGAVYPAGGLVRIARMARRQGAATLDFNLEPSKGSSLFDHNRFGHATQIVPAWVDELLAGCTPQKS